MDKIDLRQTPGKLTTIIVDASYCSNTKAGGWGAWVVSDGLRSKTSGPLKPIFENSTQAEATAIVNGLIFAGNSKYFEQEGHVIMQSDCVNAFGLLAGMDNNNEIEQKIYDKFHIVLNQYPITLEFRHVRGHQSNTRGARYYANNWADKQAKLHMRKLREQINKERQRTQATSKLFKGFSKYFS